MKGQSDDRPRPRAGVTGGEQVKSFEEWFAAYRGPPSSENDAQDYGDYCARESAREMRERAAFATTRHTHVSTQDARDDSCVFCGHDLRNDIHFRQGDALHVEERIRALPIPGDDDGPT